MILRPSLRRLRRQPGFTALAVVIVALGIGATTAMFSLLNVLVLRPLPVPHADRLVRIHRTSGLQQEWAHSPPNVRDLRVLSADVLDGVAAWNARSFSLSMAAHAALAVEGLEVSADFFSLLGLRPLQGRFFLPEEEGHGRNQVVVLGAELWWASFGGDPRVVGRRVQLDGQGVTVVGIAPPELSSTRLWGKVQMWRPLGIAPARAEARRENWLEVMARLAPGVNEQAARARLAVVGARLDRASGGDGGTSGLRMLPLHRSALDDISRRIVWLSMVLAALVLLIACINLAGLTIARHAARSREQAVRLALGASRGRLWRETVTESAALALVGGVLGVWLARWVVDLVGPRIGQEVPIDPSVLLLSLGLVTITALLVGSAPTLLVSGQLQSGGKLGAGRGTDGSRPRLRQALVVGQLALSLVLLATSVQLLRGLDRLVSDDPGWQIDGLVTARLELPASTYPDAAARREFSQRLEARMATIPAVAASALSWWLPLESASPTSYLTVEGQPQLLQPGHHQRRASNDVTPDYFTAMGLRLLEGRPFNAGDGPDSEPVTIVNQTVARRFWPQGQAIGKRIGRMGQGEDGWARVVGVVADVRYPAKLSRMVTRLQVYRPLAQQPRESLVLHLRAVAPSESAFAALASALRATVAELDPRLALRDIVSARAALDRELRDVNLIGWILLGFATVGLLLAAAGIHGLFSGLVVMRTREIGVRVALGADRPRVLRLILDKALVLAALGVVLGLPLALGAAPLLRTLAPELPAGDLSAVIAVASLLAAVALLAGLPPARRAAAIDPMAALRQD